MDTISDFYKNKETANHGINHNKWFYKFVAYDDRYNVVSGYLNDYLSGKSGLKILDVACGTGIYERMLDFENKAGNHFTGFDISGPHIERNKANKVFDEMIEGDLTQGLFLEENSYDIIILSEIVEHLWEPENIVKECYRCLKEGGIFVFTTPNLCSLQNRLSFTFFGNSGEIDYATNFQHIRFFSKKGIKKLTSTFSTSPIYERGLASLFFHPHNFPFYLPIPRFMQKFFSRFFPNTGLGFLKVYKK